MSNKDILLDHVRAKFRESERPEVILVDVALLSEQKTRRQGTIITIVHSGEEAALFILSSSDFSIEQALPIDPHFICSIDDDRKDNLPIIRLTITYKTSKYFLELKIGGGASDFVDKLYRAIELGGSRSDQTFLWLRNYVDSASETDADISPELIIPRQSIAQGTAVATKEMIIKYYMQIKENSYMVDCPFRIYTATWNVNGQVPTMPLNTWLCPGGDPPDIYAIGFQELDLSKEAFLFDITSREQDWFNAVMDGIDKREQYRKVELVRLVGMMLIVLVQEKHFDKVKNVLSCTVGTGFMGKFGNKGGVSIRFDLHNTSLCFVNSHLAAHHEEYERRNQDFHIICEKTVFSFLGDEKRIEDHDQVYWIGDLNYRITGMDHIAVKEHIAMKNYSELIQADQLKIQQQIKAAFEKYTEGPITFRPTYKYDPNTNEWDSSDKSRAPAWCDRILYLGNKINQLTYDSFEAINISDHKPVGSLFVSQIRITDIQKYRRVHEEVIKKCDKWENEFLPHVTVDPTEVTFDTVRFLEPQVQEICIANTGQVPVRFEFINKLDESTYCKDWLHITPHTKCIRPGEKCDVKFEVFVSKKSAYKFNSGEDKLYDILVLHLDGGKDIFITVSGTYERSCFGSSIEALVHIKVPIGEMPVGKLVDYENEKFQSPNSKLTYAIPKEIWFLIDHMFRYGMKKPNLFRQPGLHSEIVLIRNWLDQGSSDLIPGSIHSIAETIVLFLESTPEPIIPYNLHNVCLSSVNFYLQCKQIVMQLPEFRKNVFLYICLFLQDVLRYSSENGTDPKTVSILFGCTFLRELPKTQLSGKARLALEQKKGTFVHHFLVNDLSDLISQ